MPPIGSILGQDWLNQNATRQYPLSDDATCKDTSDSFTLPNDLIVDAIIPVSTSNAYDPDGFHLSEVAIFGQGVVVSFSYTDPDTLVETLIGKLAIASSHVENTTYVIAGLGDFSDVYGKITIGSLTTVLRFGGVYAFDREGGKLLSTVIRPDIRGVSALYVRNGSDLSDPIYGDIELVAGANVSIEYISSSQIRINAISGENLNLACNCASTSDIELAPCIRSINGVRADTGGNLTITGQNCLSITSGSNGVVLDDTCAKPCCTNVEVERIVNDLNDLNSDVRTQGFTMTQLETRLIQLESLAHAIAATGFIL